MDVVPWTLMDNQTHLCAPALDTQEVSMQSPELLPCLPDTLLIFC